MEKKTAKKSEELVLSPKASLKFMKAAAAIFKKQKKQDEREEERVQKFLKRLRW